MEINLENFYVDIEALRVRWVLLGVAPSDLSTRLHLLAGRKGNNVFCFPITLRGENFGPSACGKLTTVMALKTSK